MLLSICTVSKQIFKKNITALFAKIAHKNSNLISNFILYVERTKPSCYSRCAT